MIRVTEVLNHLTEPELLNWYLTKGKAFCKKVSEEAMRIGSSVDLMIQQDVKGLGYTIPNGDGAIANCMTAWEKFKADHPAYVPSITGLQLELTDGHVVGHPDIILPDQIDDIKCSRSIKPIYWTQTAKYASMADKSKIGVLRLDKDTADYEYRVQGKEVIDYELEVFEAYFKVYKHNTTIREIVRKQLEAEVLGE